MKMPIKTALVLSLSIASGVLLLYTSQAVQDAERELRHAQGSLAKEIETTHILETEWSFLSAPERLETLAEEHLRLKATQTPIVSNWEILGDDEAQSIKRDASFGGPH